jgi:glycosyltransferase involved in cell wall biosynthesis
MKNHHLVLEALQRCTSTIEYRIYGPIKDAEYWESCKQLINKLPDNVTVEYGGEISPSLVPEKLGEAHFFILPSKSENFGYAFIEALSLGRPVITSHFTPWNELQEAKAGFNININNTLELQNAIEECCKQQEEVYNEWCRSSRNYALSHIDFAALQKQCAHLYSA